ncbi:MAG: hypothetical protein AAGH57_04095 [Pseudomonadota bacterium]
MGDIFVGILVFIGALMLAYRGSRPWVSTMASFAGVCAVGVALFPTDGWICDPDFDLQCENHRLFPELSQFVHFGSAGVLFVILAIFCFRVFARKPERAGVALYEALPLSKIARNTIYFLCGGVISLAILLMGIAALGGIPDWNEYDGTFVAETCALFAFGVAWMTNGRFFFGFLADPYEQVYWKRATIPTSQ